MYIEENRMEMVDLTVNYLKSSTKKHKHDPLSLSVNEDDPIENNYVEYDELQSFEDDDNAETEIPNHQTFEDDNNIAFAGTERPISHNVEDEDNTNCTEMNNSQNFEDEENTNCTEMHNSQNFENDVTAKCTEVPIVIQCCEFNKSSSVIVSVFISAIYYIHSKRWCSTIKYCEYVAEIA